MGSPSLEIDHIAVVGLGYIGLPTAAAFATRGFKVTGVDIKTSTVEAVNRGEVPFVEPDLGVAVSGAVSNGTLQASLTMPAADAYVLSVPTPFSDGHSPDLSYVKASIESIAPLLKGGELIVLESTSPPGTTRKIAGWLAEQRPDLLIDGMDSKGDKRRKIFLAHAPERVLPGRVMIEIVTNDRIIGGLSPEASRRAADLYGTFVQGEILITDATTAELAKLAENAFRDVNIAFANELSIVADRLGVDVWDLIRLANHHPRVNILQPGPGVGGHCIAVDPWFIVDAAPDVTNLIRTAREVNDSKPGYVLDKVVNAARRLKEPKIAVLGLSFKANIDDLRESPSLALTAELVVRLPDATVEVIEPHIEELPDVLRLLKNVTLADNVSAAIKMADIVLLLVDHTQFKAIHKSELTGKMVFDTRGLWR